MIKIITSEQTQELDQYTIENEPVSGLNLMERAAHRLFQAFKNDFPDPVSVDVFCGPGNNGGDGLVIARKLKSEGYKVRVFILHFTDKFSPDFKENEKRLKDTGVEISVLKSVEDFPAETANFAVDAVFGSGLSRKVEGMPGEVIRKVNEADYYRVAVDVPSGLFSENNDDNDGVVFKADKTYTFQAPKLAFMFAENARYTGEIKTLDIGLDKGFVARLQTKNTIAEKHSVSALIKKRSPFSHKGTYGHACIAAGSKGMIGAAVLSAQSCLRSGVGLLTVRVPRCGYTVIQNRVPEALCIEDENDDFLKDDIDYSSFKAVGIGPGIGTEPETRFMLEELITTEDIPLILDADALNIMEEFEPLKRKLTPGSILTPHPGEFKRIFGDYKPVKRLEVMRKFTSETGCYILYKDHRSFVVTPEGECIFNSTGNPGMAAGGSGDVLTGLLTGLKAQGYSSKDTCVLGMFLHGLAGDVAVKEVHTYESLISGDLTHYLPKAWKTLQQND